MSTEEKVISYVQQQIMDEWRSVMKYEATAKKTKTLNQIIDELAKKEGYPDVKLSHSIYTAILKKAHKIKYGK
jgi:hypothetical protein